MPQFLAKHCGFDYPTAQAEKRQRGKDHKTQEPEPTGSTERGEPYELKFSS
jgi:hypothetical protein